MNVRDTEAVIDNLIEELRGFEEKDDKVEYKVVSKQKKIFKRTKDVRIFINTIRNAVNMLKNYGLAVQYSQFDKGDLIEITVRIPKM